MTYIPIEDVDVNKIPTSGLDRYKVDELRTIARYSLQAMDIKLTRDRWKLVDEKSATKKELMRLINRFAQYGTKA